MKAETPVAAAVALAWGASVAVAGYGVVRAVQFFLYPDPNPTTLVWSAHAGFFWRCWTCGYGGALAAIIAFVAARRNVPAAARSLVVAVAVAAVVLSAQVAVFP